MAMPHRITDAELWRVTDAELWGVHRRLLTGDGLEVRTASGKYGTLYEIECSSPGRASWLPAILELIPPQATFMIIPGSADDEESDGAFLIHYWRDARNRTTTGSARPRTQERKPAQ